MQKNRAIVFLHGFTFSGEVSHAEQLYAIANL